ncbi:uncharacterized protein LOC128556259 [Mercenaria mercenaria]|uniref:uncharacterized protein LOC128556259 n=1 Tax=Mercenaria mercenaria TaxID=6596 RepID=UPI00234F24F0|nr:uncharacterized protein LOC128556259 [Mercenaria mercenaria]
MSNFKPARNLSKRLNRDVNVGHVYNNSQTTMEMVNSRVREPERFQCRGKDLQNVSNSNQLQKCFSWRNRQSTSTGQYDYNRQICTKGISTKRTTVQQPDKIHASPTFNASRLVNHRSSLPGLTALPKAVQDTPSPRNVHPGASRRFSKPCVYSCSLWNTRKSDNTLVSSGKSSGNNDSKQSNIQFTETGAKYAQPQKHTAQNRYYPGQVSVNDQQKRADVSKQPHELASFCSPKTYFRNADSKQFQFQPAVIKPSTYQTKLKDLQRPYSPQNDTVNEQRRLLSASEKSFCSDKQADYKCASPESTAKHYYSKQLQIHPAVNGRDTFLTQPKATKDKYSEENVNCTYNGILSKVSKQLNEFNSSVNQNATIDDQRGVSIVKERSFRSSSFCSVKEGDSTRVPLEINSRHNDSEQLQPQSCRVIETNTFLEQPNITQDKYLKIHTNKRTISSFLKQPTETSSSLCQNVTVNDQRRLACVPEVSFERSSSFCSVRQAGNVQVSVENDSRNEENKHLQIQSRVTETNTFLTQPTDTQDTFPLQNVTVDNQRKLLIVPEKSFESSSTFCSVRQARNTSRNDDINMLQLHPSDSNCTHSKERVACHAEMFSPEQNITDIKFICGSCLQPQEVSKITYICSSCGPFEPQLFLESSGDHKIHSFFGECLKERNYASSVKQDSEAQKKELHDNLPYLNFIEDVCIKTEDDSQPCQITGFCQLQNGKIVLTEMNNKTIKSLDYQNYQVINVMSLSNYPMDICSMEECKALVILHESPIQCRCICINVDDQIELKEQKILKHASICVAYCNEKIFIGNSRCKGVYIYDKSWAHLDTISNDLFRHEEIFSNQFKIAVFEHNNETRIYISDEDNGMHSVRGSTEEITKKWTFKDHANFKATGMCNDSKGDLLLIDKDSQRLIKLNAEGMILSVLLDNWNGTESLNIPFQNMKNNNLIIALYGKDIIRVFHLK